MCAYMYFCVLCFFQAVFSLSDKRCDVAERLSKITFFTDQQTHKQAAWLCGWLHPYMPWVLGPESWVCHGGVCFFGRLAIRIPPQWGPSSSMKGYVSFSVARPPACLTFTLLLTREEHTERLASSLCVSQLLRQYIKNQLSAKQGWEGDTPPVYTFKVFFPKRGGYFESLTGSSRGQETREEIKTESKRRPALLFTW